MHGTPVLPAHLSHLFRRVLFRCFCVLTACQEDEEELPKRIQATQAQIKSGNKLQQVHKVETGQTLEIEARVTSSFSGDCQLVELMLQ